MPNDKLEQLLLTENAQLRKLNEIVLSAIEEEKLLSQRLYELDENQPPLDRRSPIQLPPLEVAGDSLLHSEFF